jgi:hypothetical protein
LNLPLTSLVTDIYRNLSTRYPTADHSAALLELERLNAGIRLGGTGSIALILFARANVRGVRQRACRSNGKNLWMLTHYFSS